jgi:hypothetical protein
VAAIFLRNKHPVAREFRAANARLGVRLHPWVPDLPLLASVLADSFLTAKAALFPADDRLTLDRRLLAERCVGEMPADDADEQEWVMRTVRDTLRDDAALLAWFDTRFAGGAPPPRPAGSLRPDRFGFDGERLHLDAASLGVADVAGAVDLTARVLGFGSGPIAYDSPGPATVAARARAEVAGRDADRDALSVRLAAAVELLRTREAELDLAQRDGALRYVPRRVARKVAGLIGSLGRRAAGLW